MAIIKVAISGQQWSSVKFTRSRAADQPRLLAAPDGRTHPREREGQLWTVAHLQAAEFDRAVGRPRGRRRVVLGPRARRLLRNVNDGLEEPHRWRVALRGPSEGHQRAIRGPSEDHQRVIRGPSESHPRAIRGPSEGHQRAISGPSEGHQWPLPAAVRGTRGAFRVTSAQSAPA